MWPVLILSVAMNVVAPVSRDAQALGAELHAARAVNAIRVQHGLAPVSATAALADAARRHSARMAAAGGIFHTTSLHGAVRGWQVLGENVGLASSAEDVMAYFMDSPDHRALILDPEFTSLGAGVVVDQGSLFVTLLFGSR